MADTRATLLRILQAVALIATLIIILFPLYWMVAGSLKTMSTRSKTPTC
jgi:ABC-type glycerol-3-phosphate transport system permease component